MYNSVMKTCNSCSKEFPAEDFASRSAKCKPCHREYLREHYKNNKKYYVDKAARRSAEQAKLLDEYKESRPCADCENFFPAICMDFDHVRGEKKFNVSERRSWGVSQSFKEELEKCELVCANCHRIRTKNRYVSIA